jgi:hypothetical protein
MYYPVRNANNSNSTSPTTKHGASRNHYTRGHQVQNHCRVAWNKINQNDGITRAMARIFLSPNVLSHPRSGVEDLQVLEYQQGGEFILHHDGVPRVLTIIYYLNGIAGTWFPLADADGDDKNKKDDDEATLSSTTTSSPPLNKGQALDLCEPLEPGQNGVLVVGASSPPSHHTDSAHRVAVHPGDALAFFNYCPDGRINWKAIHAGLPVEEGDDAKWIANHWFQFGLFAKQE